MFNRERVMTPQFFLWQPITGQFDSDWHHSAADANAHANRCGLGADWQIAELSDAQQAQLFAVAS